MHSLGKSVTVLFFAAVISVSHDARACDPVDADWKTLGPTSAGGDLAGHDLNLTGLLSAPTISIRDLSGPAYSGAPLSSSEEMLIYGYGSHWTVTFESPIENLLLYATSWRGTTGTGDDVTYTFDRPFTILSGFPNGIINGSTLLLPSGSFENGILLFEGAVSSLSVSGVNSPGGFSQQLLTFGQRPQPGCPTDFNGDCMNDVTDLLAVLTAWGPCPGCPQDVTGDGEVNVLDLMELLAAWGWC